MTGCPFCTDAFVHKAEWVLTDNDAQGEIVVLVVEPLNPVAPGHRLVVPRRHVTDVTADPYLSAVVMRAAASYAARYEACNIITSKGAAATQTVPHLHLHVVPRRAGDGLALPWTGQAS